MVCTVSIDTCEPGQTNQHKREKNLNRHRPGVRWPRACVKTSWDSVNTDLPMLCIGKIDWYS